MLKEKLTLQEYLSLGYIFLIVLGIISDVIYFKFLEVDILTYSTILDVIISPLNILTKKLKLFFVIVGVIVFSYFMMTHFLPKFHKKNRHKKWYNTTGGVKRADKMYEGIEKNKGVSVMLYVVFCLFIGMGIGRGQQVRSIIQNEEIEANHKITFANDSIKNVYVVGQNSIYLFYVLKGEKEVSISSINPNIKVIKKINEEK